MSACQTQRAGNYYQNFEEQDIQAGIIGDEDFEMEIAYVGAIGHSFVYECYFKNLSTETIELDKSHFYMEHGDGDVIFPSEGDAIAEALKKAKKKLKKEKKGARALGILGVGLTTLFGVAEGVPVGEALLFSAEPIVYIFDEQRWYSRGINSIDDEIEYVRNAQFDRLLVLPGEEITRDLLFATTKIKSDVDINYSHQSEPFRVTFPKKLYRQ